MELTVYERGTPVGTARLERDGIFWNFFCEMTDLTEQIRRVYVGTAWDVFYLGIPDAAGKLSAKRRHLPAKPTFAVAAPYPRGEWLPWRGAVDGVSVETALIRREDGGIRLLLPPEEAVKFPAWLERTEKKTVFDTEFAMLSLTEDGRLPQEEKDKGEENHEEENTVSTFNDLLPADPPADDGIGGEGWETDRPDL